MVVEDLLAEDVQHPHRYGNACGRSGRMELDDQGAPIAGPVGVVGYCSSSAKLQRLVAVFAQLAFLDLQRIQPYPTSAHRGEYPQEVALVLLNGAREAEAFPLRCEIHLRP